MARTINSHITVLRNGLHNSKISRSTVISAPALCPLGPVLVRFLPPHPNPLCRLKESHSAAVGLVLFRLRRVDRLT